MSTAGDPTDGPTGTNRAFRTQGTLEPADNVHMVPEGRSVPDPDELPTDAGPPAAGGPRIQQRLYLLTIGLRWVAIGAGLALAALDGPRTSTVVAGAGLVAAGAVATARQVGHHHRGTRLSAPAVAELVTSGVAAAATGGVDSPFILTPLTGLLVAGYVLGRRAAALGQVARLAAANELLVSLHALAPTLPAPFDLGEVAASIRRRLRAQFPCTGVVVMVHEDTTDCWRVEIADGVRMPARLAPADLPGALRRALAADAPVLVADRLASAADDGFAALARSGLYGVLRARGVAVGAVALEHVAAHAYTAADAATLRTLADALGLAIDNARLFGRIRTLAVEAERARLARELHDRLAQSLAYVGFELDRLAGSDVRRRSELLELRAVVQDLVRGLRETIYELRTDIDEETDLVALAEDHLTRWSARTGIRVTWTADAPHRLPAPVEQEVWRVLQEALTNVERHAHAAHVDVTWTVDDATARLAVADDGCGFDPRDVGAGHYGLVGMRERADAVGARLHVDSRPGLGARVVLQVPVRAIAGVAEARIA
jgi:signal transduction histidine kinase